MADEAQSEADSIATDQTSQSIKPKMQQKPMSPDQDGQAVQNAAYSTQSACQPKTRDVAQQYNSAVKPAPLQASSHAQQPTTTQRHREAHDSSIKPQPASLNSQATGSDSLDPGLSETCESALASVPQLLTSATTNQLLDEQQARILFENKIQSLVVPYLPSLQKRSFHLFVIDVTSQPRQFSPTLQDRGFVYQPNAIRGNKPVTIGHQYSVV